MLGKVDEDWICREVIQNTRARFRLLQNRTRLFLKIPMLQFGFVNALSEISKKTPKCLQ